MNRVWISMHLRPGNAGNDGNQIQSSVSKLLHRIRAEILLKQGGQPQCLAADQRKRFQESQDKSPADEK